MQQENQTGKQKWENSDRGWALNLFQIFNIEDFSSDLIQVFPISHESYLLVITDVEGQRHWQLTTTCVSECKARLWLVEVTSDSSVCGWCWWKLNSKDLGMWWNTRTSSGGCNVSTVLRSVWVISSLDCFCFTHLSTASQWWTRESITRDNQLHSAH